MSNEKRGPPVAKLTIGPIMVLTEMLLGGHYMESVKIIKQSTGRTYPCIVKELWRHDGWLGFYRGFLPWGLTQITKGIPVLYIQAEARYRLKQRGVGDKTAATLAGVTAGVGQGIFLTPTQRLKTIAMTDPNFPEPKGVVDSLRVTTRAFVDAVRAEGVGTLFKGIAPMMLKRGIDWGIRYNGHAQAKAYFQDGDSTKKLSFLEDVAAGYFGGVISTMTMPLDTWVANCQKHRKAGAKSDAVTVAKEMWTEAGWQAFTRGWLMRCVHAGWHTCFMVGVGNKVFSLWEEFRAE